MKKSSASLLVGLSALIVSAFTACSNVPEGVHPAYVRNNQDFNFVGLVSYEPGSYKKLLDDNINVETSQLYPRKNISGDNLTLLWGTVVVADY